MVRSTDITSFTELRQNLREHLDRVKGTDRPLFITTNGETEAIMLSSRVYDEMLDRLERVELIERLRLAAKESEEGKTIPLDEAFRELAHKYGLKLNL